MRRLQALALALMLFVAVIVAGCSVETTSSSTTNSPSAATPDSSELPAAIDADVVVSEVGDTELVSLALPAMIWGGCEQSVRSALANVSEITDLQCQPAPSGGTCTFKVAKGFDYKSKLDAIVAGGNSHIKKWKVTN